MLTPLSSSPLPSLNDLPRSVATRRISERLWVTSVEFTNMPRVRSCGFLRLPQAYFFMLIGELKLSLMFGSTHGSACHFSLMAGTFWLWASLHIHLNKCPLVWNELCNRTMKKLSILPQIHCCLLIIDFSEVECNLFKPTTFTTGFKESKWGMVVRSPLTMDVLRIRGGSDLVALILPSSSQWCLMNSSNNFYFLLFFDYFSSPSWNVTID